ncbi:hypothetical protein [Limosilactobacillus sp.]|uniref:hypothetical protein n=1 Tax=Limosilactobacillus sp. TaxID=2773925 RepID=UPI00345E0FF1
MLSITYVFLLAKSRIIYVADDRTFHIERFEEAYWNILHGHLISYVQTNSFARIEQAINSFYPPFTAILFALLRIVLHSPVRSIYALIFLEQFLGLNIAYWSGKRILRSSNSAFIFSIILRFSTYVMYNDFSRFDVGESWSFVFIPLTICGLVTIARDHIYKQGSLYLAVGLTLQTWSHILLPIMTVFILIVFGVILVIIDSKRQLINELIAVFVAALIWFINCLVILVPIMHMSHIGTFTPNLNTLGNYNLTFGELFSYSISNTILRGGHYGIGLILMTVLIAGLFVFKKSDQLMRAYYLLGLFSTILATNLFPWSILHNTFVSTIQFPWRLLDMSILFLSLFGAELVANNFKKGGVIFITLLALILTVGSESQFKIQEQNSFHIASSSYDMYYSFPTLLNSSNYDKILSDHRVKTGYVRFQDYVPLKAQPFLNDLFDHKVVIGKKEYHPTKIIDGFQSNTFVVDHPVKLDTHVSLPFLIYKKSDYKLLVNGRIYDISDRHNYLNFVAKKNMNKMKIKIVFVTPKIFKLSLLISFIGFVITVFSLVYIQASLKYKNI